MKLRTKLPLILSVLFIFLVAVFALQLKVKQTECYTVDGACPENIQSEINQLIGQRILVPTSAQFKKTLLEKYKLKSIHIARRLPATLIARVELSEILGNLSTDITGSVSVTVNTEGQIVSNQRSTLLPTLLVSSLNRESPKVSAEMVLGLSTLNSLQKIIQTPLFGEIEGTTLVATYPNGPKIIIDMSSDEKSWIAPLQSILTGSKISTTKPKKIDLRFANPVLTYN